MATNPRKKQLLAEIGEYLSMTYVYIFRSGGRSFDLAQDRSFDYTQGKRRQLYIGVTEDLRQRLEYHNTGRCPHTSKFKPWEIVYAEQYENETDAFKRERQIKGWTRAKKEALIAGNKLKLKKLSKRKFRSK